MPYRFSKKILPLAQAFILALILTGCGGKEDKKPAADAASLRDTAASAVGELGTKAREAASSAAGAVERTAKESARAVREYTQSEKDEYLKSVEVRLTELTSRARKLRNEVVAFGEKGEKKVAKRLQKRLKKLERQEERARKAMEELRQAGKEQWVKTRVILDQTMQAMESTVTAVADKLAK